MKNKTTNPFITISYAGNDYFCDRENETTALISGLENGRNITLISPRRMGKTGLIKHIFAEIESKNKNIKCFYLDVFSTSCLADFVKIFGEAVIGNLDSNSTRAMNKVNVMYGMPLKIYDEVSVSVALDMIMSEQEDTFTTYCKLLTNNQKALLYAISQNDYANEVSSNDFIVRYELPSPSSTRLSLSYLVDNELVLETNRGYRVYNRFFSLWLKAKSKKYIMSL